jgi:two-component system, LytTR family, sensor histidine kinase AlgZ
MQSFIQRNRILLMHLSFWGVYFSFFLYQASFFGRRGDEPDFLAALWTTSFHVFFVMVAAYINYFVMLPRFLKHKNELRYLVEFIGPFVFITGIYIFIKQQERANDAHFMHFFNSGRFIIQHSIGALFVVIFVGMLRFANDWFELETKRKEIENEKLASELRFLKAQINPHFLFNTLNNLYYLAFTQSPNTTTVIEKLSQMMRYMIYDSNHAKVPLNKEIEYIKNYISLEKLRLDERVPIELSIEGNTDGLMIAPFIFIAFLENAFKHGVTNDSTYSWIKIKLQIHDKNCVYSIENSKLARGATTDEVKQGIGLQNVKRRLELSYPQEHELMIKDEAEQYAVELNLILS